MKVSDIRDAKSAERQASEWLVLMQAGEPSAEDQARFDAWLREPAHRAAYTELEGTWTRLHAAGGRVRARGMRQEEVWGAHPAPSGGRRRHWRVTAWAGAASVLLALLAGTWLVSHPVETQYTTLVGERRTIALPDGSSVELNTDTRLSVAYSRRFRQVTLRRGEAYFDVARDASRPFVVRAGPGAIRAVGTAFVVRMTAPEHVAVTVTEGVVELTHNEPPTGSPKPRQSSESLRPTLTTGERAEIDRDATRIEKIPQDELARSHAWRQGLLIFDGQPLDEVLREVGRYTGTRLIIADDDLKELRIGGAFRAGDVDALLEVLEKGFQIAVIRSGTHTVQLYSAESRRFRPRENS